MDGRTGAEDLIARLLQDPALLQALAADQKPAAVPTAEPDKE
jgi:type VI secretion system protein ImpB